MTNGPEAGDQAGAHDYELGDIGNAVLRGDVRGALAATQGAIAAGSKAVAGAVGEVAGAIDWVTDAAERKARDVSTAHGSRDPADEGGSAHD
jgi:hypothetical protein